MQPFLTAFPIYWGLILYSCQNFSFPRWEGIAKIREKAKMCEKDMALRPSHSPFRVYATPSLLPL